MKHRIVGFIVLLALLAVSLQFFLEYQKTNHNAVHLQAYRSPPIPPLSEKMTSPENAPATQSANELMQKHFNAAADSIQVASAWVVQVATLSKQATAEALVVQLQALGFDAFTSQVLVQNQPFFRINAGPFTQQADAMAAISSIQKNLKITGILKQYTPEDLQSINFPAT